MTTMYDCDHFNPPQLSPACFGQVLSELTAVIRPRRELPDVDENWQPLVQVGQLYLLTELNEYAIITKNNLGQISFQGVGFKGECEEHVLVNEFGPVDPVDVPELSELLKFCPAGTTAKVGWYKL